MIHHDPSLNPSWSISNVCNPHVFYTSPDIAARWFCSQVVSWKHSLVVKVQSKWLKAEVISQTTPQNWHTLLLVPKTRLYHPKGFLFEPVVINGIFTLPIVQQGGSFIEHEGKHCYFGWAINRAEANSNQPIMQTTNSWEVDGSSLPKTNIFAPEKWMDGIRSFPLGKPQFQGLWSLRAGDQDLEKLGRALGSHPGFLPSTLR